MQLESNYFEKVYAGVLGKIIGVYLGRAVEQWSYEDITRQLGEIRYYVSEKVGKPLVVRDDDISGTFTFLRSLEDHGFPFDLTPEQVGQTWLNYIIPRRSILWWGGYGVSTEHTAFVNLENGIKAPQSGSIAQNGQTVAEQIGAQIFIDGWGLVCPGDPQQAVKFAEAAARVSHDGEAVYAAQVVAAMVAQAFVENDVDALIDTALQHIPSDCLIRRMIDDIRGWHAGEKDWRVNFERIQDRYGYRDYGGGCHVIPNHALIILSLLHGQGDFHESMVIVNTAGWDTDCNAGNVGCILGVAGGLPALDNGPDWRGPVADRLYLPTADGGRYMTDALREAVVIVNMARRLNNESALVPKNGARFHFSLPGSVQGFMPDSRSFHAPLVIENADIGTQESDTQSAPADNLHPGALALRYRQLSKGVTARAMTAVMPPREDGTHQIYDLVACPLLYSGQTVSARVIADAGNPATANVRLVADVLRDAADTPNETLAGDWITLKAGQAQTAQWTVPDTGGFPISEVGLELTSDSPQPGTVCLDWLDWKGAPTATYPFKNEMKRAEREAWRSGWVSSGMSVLPPYMPSDLYTNDSTQDGLSITGAADWADYTASMDLEIRLARKAGLVVNYQGLRRYCAFVVVDSGKLQLIRRYDDTTTILAETDAAVPLNQRLRFAVTSTADGQLMGAFSVLSAMSAQCSDITDTIEADSDSESSPKSVVSLSASVLDEKHPVALNRGAAGFICHQGALRMRRFSVAPVAGGKVAAV